MQPCFGMNLSSETAQQFRTHEADKVELEGEQQKTNAVNISSSI